MLFCLIELVWNALRLLIAETMVVKPFIHARNRAAKAKCLFKIGDNLISMSISVLSQMLDKVYGLSSG